MKRALDIIIDRPSWAPSTPPAALLGLAGTREMDVGMALLFTALHTRPPTTHGFHLSDYWAWLRYRPAISDRPLLRLREAWTTVDRHQKTVLSDELGVGFTTLLVSDALQCIEFVDTLYFIEVLEPGKFLLGHNPKTGPQKSPDYIAITRSSEYVVLECKGTQTSRNALRDALNKGKVQKKNVKAGSARIQHSLVAGLYIPQWFAKGQACIHIADPSWEALDALLAQQPTHRIDDAITQISLAKQLALCGLVRTPEHLTSHRAWEVPGLPAALRSEVAQRPELAAEELQLLFDTADIYAGGQAIDTVPRARFLAKAPPAVLQGLAEKSELSEFITHLRESARASQWIHDVNENSAQITTPLGFTFRVEFDGNA